MSELTTANSQAEIARLQAEVRRLQEEVARSRELERQYRLERARRQSHWTNTPVGAIFWDTNLRVIEWNPAAEQIFGYSADEAIGAHVLDLVVHRDARDHVDGVVRELLAQTGGSRSINNNITKDGQTITCDWYNTPVMDDQGAIVGIVSLALDITDQEETAQVLSQSEGMLRSIVENAPDIIMLIDRQARISYINRVEMGLTRAQVIGQPVEQFVVAEDRPALEGAIERVFATGQPEEYEVREFRAGRWYYAKLAPIVEEGETKYLVAICVDMHQRREQERALRESEHRLRVVTSQIPAVLWTTDKQLRFTSSIGAGLERMGLQQNQVVGMTLQGYFGQEDREFAPLAAAARALAGQSANYVQAWGDRWYQVHTEPLREADAQIIGTIGIALDITEQRTAELERRKSEQTFEILAKNVPGVVYLCKNDERYTMLYLNDEVESLLGVPAGEFLADRVSFVELYHPHDAAVIPPAVDAAIANRTPFHLKYRLRRADGEWIWVEEHGQGVYDDEGNLRFLVGSLFDITTKRLAEEALLRSKEELERMVGVRTAELRTANRLLREDYRRQLELTQKIRESEEKFRNMCEGNPAPVSITRAADGQILYANERLAELARAPRDELVGLSVREFYPSPMDRERLMEELKTKGQIRDRELQLRRLDGSLVWVSLSLRPTMLEGEEAVLAILLDITERKRFNEQLQSQMRMLRRMLFVHERDRQLIAYEIHDGIVQYMTGVNLYLQAAEAKIDGDPAAARRALDTGAKVLGEAIDEARRLIDGLRPGVLEEQGVVPAVRYLCEQTRLQHKIAVACDTDVQFERLAPAVEMAIYRIVQEGLNNIVKHSGASTASVTLAQRDDSLVIKIEDDGRGFDLPNVESKRYGLTGIHDRARLLGGKAKINTSPGAGTKLRIKLPLEDVLLPAGWRQPEIEWSGEDSGEKLSLPT